MVVVMVVVGKAAQRFKMTLLVKKTMNKNVFNSFLILF